MPDVWLGRAIEKRRKQISDGLPDAIDLLIVCIESGSGIDQALSRVGEELAIAYPALSAEIELICGGNPGGQTPPGRVSQFCRANQGRGRPVPSEHADPDR